MTDSTNPRFLLKEAGGRKKFFNLLADVGYVPQVKPYDAVCNAIRRTTPIRFEGHRGGGKTAFAEAISSACNLPIFTLPCLFDTTTAHILFSWDSSAQHHFVSIETAGGVPLEIAREKQWSFDFLKMGVVLDAFYYASQHDHPPVLLIDEIDKLSSDSQSALLQILARGYANVPLLKPDSRVGILPGTSAARRFQSYPIVILTSNDGDKVTSPLRSRARYSVIKSPDTEEMVRILANRVPAAGGALLYQTAKLIVGVSGLPLLEKPALREYIELLETFVDYGYKFITTEIIEQNVDCLAKTEKDVEAIYDAAESLYQSYVRLDDPDLKPLVESILIERLKRQQSKSPGNLKVV